MHPVQPLVNIALFLLLAPDADISPRRGGETSLIVGWGGVRRWRTGLPFRPTFEVVKGSEAFRKHPWPSSNYHWYIGIAAIIFVRALAANASEVPFQLLSKPHGDCWMPPGLTQALCAMINGIYFGSICKGPIFCLQTSLVNRHATHLSFVWRS